jgi:TonB-linked SusC/RagA family outer membrane protein
MTKLYQLILTLLCLFWISNNGFAQERSVSGKVTDDQGMGIPGVSVIVKSTSVGTVTDENGKFTLNLPSGATTLIFSSVGFKTSEVPVEARSQFEVQLLTDVSQLSEIVVIGYGEIEKDKITTSIGSINQKDINNLPVAGIDQALQGRLSGVTINSNGGQPGGGISVRVRGITSVNNNEPLYIIDGVIFSGQRNTSNQNFLGGGNGQTGQSVLATLNPADIEKIDVLKDASAQAIYGSLGANGVVLITTKKGKSGQGKVVYDTYFGSQYVPKKLDVLNLRETAIYQKGVIDEINAVTGGNQVIIPELANPEILGHGTDWQDEIYQRGSIQSHLLSFSGGQGKTNYYFSGGYFRQIGTLIETNFERYTVRANLDHEFKSWLKAGFSINLNRSNQKVGLSDGFDAVTSVVLYNSPLTPVRDVNGNYLNQIQVGNASIGAFANPVAIAKARDVRSVNSRAFGALYAELKFIEGLTLRNELNYNFNLDNDKAYQPFIRNEAAKVDIITPSKLREQRTNSMYWSVKNYLNYNKTFGKHNFYLTLGHEAQYSKYDYINASRNNLTLNLPSLNAGSVENQTIGAGAGEWSMESYFGRITYNFSDKYSLNATLRRDGSSSFGENNRWASIPAISAAWVITSEEFAKNLKFLNYFKLRAGFGSVGNQSTDGQNVYVANVNLVTPSPFGNGSRVANVGNPDLGWEKVRTFNVGFDASILNNRIDINFDAYKKTTTDMLLPTQLGAYSGLGTNWNDIQTPISNDGQITNNGIDLNITSYNIKKNDLTWNTTVIFSMYRNQLDRLNSDNANFRGDFDEYGTKVLVALTAKGQPVGSFYGFVTDGLYRTQEELQSLQTGLDVKPDGLWLGDIKFKDLNGDGKIDDKDVTFIGNPNPDFTLSLNNTITYKGFDLTVFMYGNFGADIYNYSRRQTEGLNSLYNNQLAKVLERYTATNTNASIPRYNQWHNNNIRVSDRFVENGTFVRIQNVQFGYNFPKTIVNKAKINALRLYISAQNLYTFTKYSGYDPEMGAINNSAIRMNIDNGRYPNPRTFTIGANVEF